MEILSAHHIVKQYAGHTALDDVSLSVPKQSIFGLLGPNGAGKTSLIRIINQITAPDQGYLLFEGDKLKPNDVEQIGYLPEERGLYKKMEVGEQVMYLAQLKGLKKNEAKARLKYWFQTFEIEPWWNKKVEELSKGMQQKIQFIATVIHEPKLLILDEPFSGFDPINANLIRTELFKLKEKGSTILFSTHNMGSVEELCDYIALIHRAKKILDGPVNSIRKAYKTNVYEIEFKGNMLGFTNAMWSGAELLEKQEEAEGYCRVKIKLIGNTTPNALLQAVLPFAEIHLFREIIPSMNDIFIAKVNEEVHLGSQSTFTE